MTKEYIEQLKSDLQRCAKENENNQCTTPIFNVVVSSVCKNAVEFIEELEEENAELKAEIENDRDLPTVAYMQGAENQKKKDEKQLTKAKEIIKKYMLFCKGELTHYKDIEEQAEQFLKELEK